MQISWSRFHQIIQMWTVSNSTWKGQLKNVQDGKSRAPGSREIQKTKVETVLRDTLYVLNFIITRLGIVQVRVVLHHILVLVGGIST